MVDSKFLIITTLCYVGIFVVVLVVCCCAWARYMRNEGRLSPRRNNLRGRRSKREQTAVPPPASIPTPQRQEYRYIGNFSELNYHNQAPNFRPQGGSIARGPFPNANHYAMVGYPPRNYYPASLVTGTGTYDLDIHMDVGSATYGETSQGGFSGDDFSDFQSSRYDTDSRPDLGVTSDGPGGVMSCSDGCNITSPVNNVNIEINGLRRPSACHELQVSANTVSNHEQSCDDDDESVESSSGMLQGSREECDGAGITPTCSVQSLSRDESEQSLTNIK